MFSSSKECEHYFTSKQNTPKADLVQAYKTLLSRSSSHEEKQAARQKLMYVVSFAERDTCAVILKFGKLCLISITKGFEPTITAKFSDHFNSWFPTVICNYHEIISGCVGFLNEAAALNEFGDLLK